MTPIDLTKPIDLTGHAEGTGPLRSRRPVYMDFMPPCNSACPAGENIQAWLSYAQEGNYPEAFRQIMVDNPFPSVMGRVCTSPCQTGCNRNHIDTTINIHAVERFIGDSAIDQHWSFDKPSTSTGKRMLVVGGGPGGLSAAYHLARMGHEVELYEAGQSLGGLLNSGVPEYRLPKKILQAEINRILSLGVKVRLNYKVKDVKGEKENGNFDAVYLSIGAQVIHYESIQQDGSVPVKTAFEFFKDLEHNTSPYIQKKLVVIGGGKLALYLSRILKRFHSEAIVLFPGDKKMMPAYDYETDDALAEGVDVQLLKRVGSIANGKFSIETMKVEKGKLVGTGEWETIEADGLIVAMGQESETGFLRGEAGVQLKEDGTIVINAERMTGIPGVFAGGDMLPGEQRSATISIGHGKKAAKYMDAYVKGQVFEKKAKPPTAGYRKLHMWYKTEAPQKEQERMAPTIAVRSFEEIAAGLSEKEARYEAQRCLSCGNCFECDGCYGACPEDAIIKLGPGNRYKFNYDACTGCGVCFEQCPCHAIEMIAEPSKINQ